MIVGNLKTWKFASWNPGNLVGNVEKTLISLQTGQVIVSNISAMCKVWLITFFNIRALAFNFDHILTKLFYFFNALNSLTYKNFCRIVSILPPVTVRLLNIFNFILEGQVGIFLSLTFWKAMRSCFDFVVANQISSGDVISNN